MERHSPPPCPTTVTVRRNPPRKARATPSSAIPLREPFSFPSLSQDIFPTELSQNPDSSDTYSSDPSPKVLSESLKVYLRIRPPVIQKKCKNVSESKNAWPKSTKIKPTSRPKTKKSDEICVQVNEDLRSVTVSTPQALQETKRTKSELYEGFSHVFASEASQSDVYNGMVRVLVEDFLKGKSGMLAAMGPSGSGKTHTVFGSARDPGMVPLALRHIFSEQEKDQTQLSRVFYLSMFEISSETGKTERMINLLQEGGDICLQNSVLKGLQEAVICNAQQAESLIACGMLKRATAMTNSNCQSSRSQCIINIRCGSEDGDEDIPKEGRHATLTIVDLAGAERGKKTGNKGARLHESNFINNTSMVFGLCLRALLEHQKNPNKLLQKHYKSSLLTRYMQDYMEGKRRMALILTVKPGIDDYLDTSFLLRQASPLAKIKFQTVEESRETVNAACHKRPNQMLSRVEQPKKMKFKNTEASLIDEGKVDRDLQCNRSREIPEKVVMNDPNRNIKDYDVENLNDIHVLSDGFAELDKQVKQSTDGNHGKYIANSNREFKIMLGLSKAIWSVLKQYKKKLEGVEIENSHLRDNLSKEKTRNLIIGNELNSEKIRVLDLENKLKEMKFRCTCCREGSPNCAGSNIVQCHMDGLQEVTCEVPSYSSKELEQTPNEKKSDSLSLEDLYESGNDAQAVKENTYTSAVDAYSRSQELSATTDDAEVLQCYIDAGGVCLSSTSQETIQLISACPHTSHNSEQDVVNILGNPTSFKPRIGSLVDGSCLDNSLELGNYAPEEEETKDTCAADVHARNQKLSNTDGADVFHCFESTVGVCMNSRSQETTPLTSKCPQLSHEFGQDVMNIVRDSKSLEPEVEFITNESCLNISPEVGNNDKAVKMHSESQELSTSFEDDEVLRCFEDTEGLNTSSRSKENIMLTSPKSRQDAVNILGDPESLETGSKFVTNLSFLNNSLECECRDRSEDAEIPKDSRSCINISLECESCNISEDAEIPKDTRTEPTQLEGATGDSSSAVVDQIVVSSSSESEGEKQNNEEGQEHLEPPGDVIMPQKRRVAKTISKNSPKPTECSNSQHLGKPKRRLRPASSVLLKDISIWNIKDENDKPKGTSKGGKRAPTDDFKNRTQGSISLLHLITGELDR